MLTLLVKNGNKRLPVNEQDVEKTLTDLTDFDRKKKREQHIILLMQNFSACDLQSKPATITDGSYHMVLIQAEK